MVPSLSSSHPAVVQQELGSINGGLVYALFSYAPDSEGHTVDEESGLPFLSLCMNETLRVLSKGGSQEEEEEEDLWWVAENKQKQRGLVPCTLLGVSGGVHVCVCLRVADVLSALVTHVLPSLLQSYPRCIGGKV